MERILDRLQGLLYVKIMPSDPKTVPFYEQFGSDSMTTIRRCP